MGSVGSGLELGVSLGGDEEGMLGEKLTVEIIQQILFQNPVHLIQCLSLGHAICTLAIIL